MPRPEWFVVRVITTVTNLSAYYPSCSTVDILCKFGEPKGEPEELFPADLVVFYLRVFVTGLVFLRIKDGSTLRTSSHIKLSAVGIESSHVLLEVVLLHLDFFLSSNLKDPGPQLRVVLAIGLSGSTSVTLLGLERCSKVVDITSNKVERGLPGVLHLSRSYSQSFHGSFESSSTSVRISAGDVFLSVGELLLLV